MTGTTPAYGWRITCGTVADPYLFITPNLKEQGQVPTTVEREYACFQDLTATVIRELRGLGSKGKVYLSIDEPSEDEDQTKGGYFINQEGRFVLTALVNDHNLRVEFPPRI